MPEFTTNIYIDIPDYHEACKDQFDISLIKILGDMKSQFQKD